MKSLLENTVGQLYDYLHKAQDEGEVAQLEGLIKGIEETLAAAKELQK